MKKSNFIVGIICFIIGVISLLLVFLTDTKLEGLLCGFAGAYIGVGIMMIYKYVQWNSSKNKEYYMEKLENDKIERHDELKEKVRGKAAQYTYTVELFVISFSIVAFSVLDSLEIIENGNVFVYFLTAFFIFQLIIGQVIFKQLMKKY